MLGEYVLLSFGIALLYQDCTGALCIKDPELNDWLAERCKPARDREIELHLEKCDRCDKRTTILDQKFQREEAVDLQDPGDEFYAYLQPVADWDRI